MTANIAKRECGYFVAGGLLRSLWSDEEFVFAPLMRPLGVIMIEPRIGYAI